MWLKYIASIKKETLLLLRDKAGLAMLFIMPMALVLIMSLLQDSSLKMLNEQHTPVLVINHDADTFGISIVKGLKNAGFFNVSEKVDGKTPSEQELHQLVNDGDFRVGIVIMPGATKALRNKIRYDIQKQFPEEENKLFDIPPNSDQAMANVKVYFDPITKIDFKHAVMGALRQFSYGVEAKMVFEAYAGLLNDLADVQIKRNDSFKKMVRFDEQYATGKKSRIIPNATQHNVPAWTIFAMFFIVIPLAGNIIRERKSGMALRLKTMPGSNQAVIVGKAAVYFLVGILQALFMLLIGVYVLPLFGMPALKVGSEIPALFLVTISVSLAASGYGILIGTVATSEEQSSIFGSISVVILAAIGGIWVPTFMMSDLMVSLSKLSPLNWGLNAYYDIFLRNAGSSDVLLYVVLLTGFAVVCILASYFYSKKFKT